MLVVNNIGGDVNTPPHLVGLQSFSLVAPPNGYPVLTIQPQSQSVVVGSNVVISAAAFGAAPLTYLWHKDGNLFSIQPNGDLALPNVGIVDAGVYELTVTNNLGSIISSPATLQILPPNAPSIRVNGQIAANNVSAANPASISISGGFAGGFIFYTLDGSTPTTSSALYSGPFNLTSSAPVRAMSLSSDFSQMVIAPTVNISIVPTYNLVVTTNGAGSTFANPATGPYLSNSTVTLTAVAGANWAFANWSGDVMGTTNPVTVTMNGPKQVQANFVPTAYPLTLTTAGGGSMTANNSNLTANTYYPAGTAVSLQANPSVGWTFVGWTGTVSSAANPLAVTMNQTQNIQAVFGTTVGINIGGSGSVQLNPPNPVPFGTTVTATAVPGPGYYFVSWNGVASGTNSPTQFSVTTATPTVGALFAQSPKPTIITDPTNTSAIQGNTAVFYTEASGLAPLTYQWRREALALPNATNANLVLPNVASSDAGLFDVVVMNGYGNTVTSKVATLTVLIPATITNHPSSQVVSYGDSASFSVGAYGNPAVSYQWLFNDSALSNQTSSQLVLTNIGTNLLGDYSVAVFNNFSAVTSSVASLLMAPSIRSSFAGDTAIWGKPTSLSVNAVGSGNLTYQWFKDGIAIANATNATLPFMATQFSDGGLYSVVVTSEWGNTTNTPALLVVNPANISLGLFAGVIIEGVPGYTYGIQASANLFDTNSWTTVTNLLLTEPTQIWVDTSVDVHAPNQQKKFYRIVAP